MSNPFSLLFGKPPTEIIERGPQADRIISDFMSDTPANQINMISGIRGSGKTVFMTEIANRIRMEKDWIVVDLNPDRDLLESLAAKLSSEKKLSNLFRRAKINLSMFGFGIEIDGEPPIVDIEEALMRMFETLRKEGKRVLITIDEATNSKRMRIFASAFQIFVRNDMPVFLLMTGLYKNIDSIRNAKTLTFLERAPRTELEPLEINSMAEKYKSALGITEETALKLAITTKGYSFAFQVLGYYAWDNPNDIELAMKKCQRYLETFAYKKIWSELSETDKEVVREAAATAGGEISLIREKLGYTTNQFNPYRARLINAGILSGSSRGIVEFLLPWFEEFVLSQDSERS